MDVERATKPALLAIQAAGLFITALLLLVISSVLQLAIRAFSFHALEPRLGPLAFSALFYVVATFLAFGVRYQPAHRASVLATLCVHGGFLCAGYVLFHPLAPFSWLLSALSFTFLVQGGGYGFALLGRSELAKLAQRRAASEDAFLERFFVAQPSSYLAIPLGAAAGLLYGGAMAASGGSLVRHAVAGTFAGLFARALLFMTRGAQKLGSALLTTHVEAREQNDDAPVAQVIGSASDGVQVHAPELTSARPELAREALAKASLLRRVWLVQQLHQLSWLVLSLLAWLELSRGRPASGPAWLALFAASLLFVPLPYALGQERSRDRVLDALSGAKREELARTLPRETRSLLPLRSWLTLIASAALGGLAYLSLVPILQSL